jgi:hypothetical protein
MPHHIAGFSEALGGWALSPAQDNEAAGSGVTANVCFGVVGATVCARVGLSGSD